MPTSPKFERAPAQERRDALISATLSLVADQGIAAATVREIAKRAHVTQGLIRHYFDTKNDLLTAAYAQHMTTLTQLTDQDTSAPGSTAKGRLRSFIEAGLRPPVAEPRAVSLWAGFLTMVRNDPEMKEIHFETYLSFRSRLEDLIAAALREVGVTPLPRELRQMSIACNAVIDGLWMEGGALPEAFDLDELPKIGVASVGAIIGLNLVDTE